MAQESTTLLFTIQEADWRDLRSLRYLEQVCFPKDGWPLVDLIGVLTYPNIVRLKAVARDKMIGFIAGDRREEGYLGWIATLGVLPNHRRQGVATALLLECERRLATAVIRLNVRRSNVPAISLYKRVGYVQVAVWPGYYSDGEEALIFEKRMAIEKGELWE
ncbi:MAG: N-acetyltransferase [Anaerolineales bacterium]|nr:GNAT family N-acetyltransferase [Anaerolineales bacterium]MCS7248748.1 GNAT family N-acetyltransferase [Anaerolineales bacterium]MDW8162561.1 N-acetyltransferase [Anaerolineales bacterium]MDW8446477.1 N-acetyltransferase [Anaerolineales bacterium]